MHGELCHIQGCALSLNGFGDLLSIHFLLVVVSPNTVVNMSSFHHLFFDEMFVPCIMACMVVFARRCMFSQ